jgi:hypothetical protein
LPATCVADVAGEVPLLPPAAAATKGVGWARRPARRYRAASTEVKVFVQNSALNVPPPAPTLTGLDRVLPAAPCPAPDSEGPAPICAHLLVANSDLHRGEPSQAGKRGWRAARRALPKGNSFDQQSDPAGWGGAADHPARVAITCLPLQSFSDQAGQRS